LVIPPSGFHVRKPIPSSAHNSSSGTHPDGAVRFGRVPAGVRLGHRRARHGTRLYAGLRQSFPRHHDHGKTVRPRRNLVRRPVQPRFLRLDRRRPDHVPRLATPRVPRVFLLTRSATRQNGMATSCPIWALCRSSPESPQSTAWQRQSRAHIPVLAPKSGLARSAEPLLPGASFRRSNRSYQSC
jgi:hypothetical protein